MLSKEVCLRGDWAVKNPKAEPGGWYFEFANEFYPDIDDTAMVLLALGGLFGAMALGCLLLGAVYLLAHVVQPWVAAVLVALGVGAIGGALVGVGVSRLKRVSLPPARTVTSVQENIQWAKAQAR